MTDDFDAVTADALRAAGSVKWSREADRFQGDTIGAFVAEMDFGAAPAVLEALHAAVDTGSFGYLPDGLTRRMAEACAGWYRGHGLDVPASAIYPVGDVLAALQLVIEHFTRARSKIILPTPAYMPFVSLPRVLGRDVLQVPLVRDGGRLVMDLAGIDEAFRAGGDLLILCNPHNPVGRVYRRDELDALCEVVDRHGGRVFADEVHAPLVYEGHRHVPYASISPTAAGHALTAISASKGWNLPGLKCAQLITTNPRDAQVWAQLGLLASHSASKLGVVANAAAYADGQAWLAGVVRYLDRNRRALAELLAELLPEVGYTMPEGTYLAWLDFRPLGLGDHPAQWLERRCGVVLTDGPDCGDAGRGHVRLNFATPLPILRQAVGRLADAVRDSPDVAFGP